MGQINLFATSLNDNLRKMIISYKNNTLWKVALVRMLSESTHPYCYAIEDSLEYNYIIIDVEEPLTHSDVTLLLRGIYYGEVEIDNKKALLTYSIERVLNPKPLKHKDLQHMRRQVRTQEEWEQVNIFRHALEVVALGMRHLKKDSIANGAHVEIYRQNSEGKAVLCSESSGGPLIIEYAPLTKEMIKAARIAAREKEKAAAAAARGAQRAQAGGPAPIVEPAPIADETALSEEERAVDIQLPPEELVDSDVLSGELSREEASETN